MGNKLVEGLSWLTRKTEQVTQDIFMLNFRAVNAFIIRVGLTDWILVDTGLENSETYILQEAESLFGVYSRPKAIILTHGHFDHVGSLKALTRLWDVPAFIHPYELPYITGEKDYPLPDPDAGDGFVSAISETFPHTAIDIGYYAAPLPADHFVPFAQNWEWIFTPGHTAGHVSLYHKRDKVLISGDAISTQKQGSLLSVITQRLELAGPPPYLTEDWAKAEESIQRLASLRPSILLPSHGRPLDTDAFLDLADMLVHKDEKVHVEDLYKS